MSDFKSLLPPNQLESMPTEWADSAILVLRSLKDAIDQKYEGRLKAQLRSVPTEELDEETMESKVVISTSFYLVARLGNGYYYQLLEIVQPRSGGWPVRLYYYQDERQFQGKFSDSNAFHLKIEELIGSRFLRSLIANLLIHVEAVA